MYNDINGINDRPVQRRPVYIRLNLCNIMAPKVAANGCV